ncbi:ankyrin repeat protein [Diplocarpon rosae]|nr:ankyrin repeat protein [Diplocarpon rosae]
MVKDSRAQPEQDQEQEGASIGEILIEAARRNNTDLLKETIDSIGDEDKVAKILNETKTVLGNHIYHEAALSGNYEVIDMLLDQPGFECDPLTRIDRDTPLHSAIRYINSLTESSPLTPAISSFSTELISMMIEAGSDPRLRNKANLTPYQLVDPRNEKLRQQLQDAVDVAQNQGDYILDGENDERDFKGAVGEEDDAGSASDSDFDLEEYTREQERRRKAGAV